ncbi:ABC transporter substrate-binding protein, partial [Burkholderia sp. SIMBA_019]|uniref:ABC transporter substrate-binding protein n=1 Tax=Burkholderia sp. SIMBA_019 TaxID=3085765 RepID=UPI00397DD29F
ALTEAIRGEHTVRKVYLIDQDYSFGHQVAKSAREMRAAKRPDIQIVGEDLHPLAQVKDFAPYAAKIKASGADTVITGNWGSDLALL